MGEPPAGPEHPAEPGYFQDLNLDRIATAVAEAGKDPGLVSLFRLPSRDVRLIGFRHQVFRDLEKPAVREAAERFTAAMSRIRRRSELVGRMKHPPQANRWFLDLVLEHAAAATAFAEGLEETEVASAGLRALRDDMAGYVREESFTRLRERARGLRDRLEETRYDLLMQGDRITVARHDPEARFDYTERVLAVFERFRRDAGEEPPWEPPPDPGLDRVEAGVLDLVVELFPGVFDDLAAFRAGNERFLPADVVRAEHELRFYLGYLAYLAPLREAGLPVCYPVVSATDKTLLARDVFDLALAAERVRQGDPVVANDVELTGAERIIVVSGPNQGGKTTLSRAFGQLHHLAALGCPVPGREAHVFLPDRIFTHYERAESPEWLTSKLEDELLRMRAILDQATSESVIILNEVFTSTTMDDARVLSEAVLASISRLDALCLWVSFVDELSELDPKAVSMVGTVADGGATRTYKVVRRPPDGHAYAFALVERHGLTRARLTERVRR
ncbi:hypothetical protein [Actinocorallia sp. B10E7]|uniref:MutS-related protein n=1 Tax=Actinocorallia sp. B10E7 TaxID=3153558 RepID=UPI00325FC79A